MNTQERLKNEIEASIKDLNETILKLYDLTNAYPILSRLPDELNLSCHPDWSSTKIDFDHPTHEQTIQIIKSLGGTWTKSYTEESGSINYETTIDGISFRIFGGEAPPNCKIIEEEVEVPAQPATTRIIRRLQCVEPTE